MTPPRIRVVKVGGSLFECESLPRLLGNWLRQTEKKHIEETRQRTTRVDVLIAGGGALVDQVRQVDQRFSLDPETSHWMSVDAMSCTARLLASLLSIGQPVRGWDELQAVVTGEKSRSIVFDVQPWLVQLEGGQSGVRLSHDWRTTSDSIAARLAGILSAEELVLLKSTDNPCAMDWQAATAQGLVDEHFPLVVAACPDVVWVNLRDFQDGCPDTLNA